MSALSDQLVTYAILAYLVAMISHAVEYALGNARAVAAKAAAPARELVGVGGSGGTDGTVSAPPVTPAEARPSRPAARGAVAGEIAAWVTALAVVLHLGAVVTRGLAAERMPWGNMYEYVLTVTFIGAAAWLAVLWKRPQLRRLGLFLTLVMVLLLAFAELKLYVQVTPLMPALQSYWFIIHVSTIIFASGIFLLGVVPAAAYLMRAGWEQGRRSFPYTLARRLPAAAGLERLTFALHAFAFPLFTFAVIAGAIWAEAAWGRAWGWDPKETWAFISWVVYAGYLHARATPSVKRNVATWIAVLGFLTMLMNLFGVNFFFTGLHSYAGLS
ncbi:cytochrome c-type biogenesis protein CcsB [Micromonospora viridifaciens]|uniref:Cytochrome c-type biogenesis protein CcsB n=1 Tax=Micromonospora viridifaciens TaxID=1881 RepID=A0A1C4U2Y5_MICVI|nr:c-type cytochrome biogenesis protein CcsB [Micromonospora viridifaciens]SCE66004.1 cytochrome c-type biogenesis protein CcsB [Micromonospora viridifaciens]